MLMPVAMGITADIVNVENVDLGDAETLLAVLEGFQDGVIGVVVGGAEWERADPAILFFADALIGHHQAAGLRADDVAVPLAVAQQSTEAALGPRVAVIGSGVEITNSLVPGGFRGGLSLGIAGGAIEPTHRRTPKTKCGEGQISARKGAAIGNLHDRPSVGTRQETANR
jgi:hypothetical protein